MRTAKVSRSTAETEITVEIDLDGTGTYDNDTGVGFFDHMLDQLSRHSLIDMTIRAKGDYHIDDHHTAEDCGLALGSALREALGDRSGITRFGYAYAPLDEALARAVVDISGRPFATIDLGLARERLGELSCENIPHVLSSLATAAGIPLHVDVLRGDNDHHRAEAAFKATALALRAACARRDDDRVPSTKEVLA